MKVEVCWASKTHKGKRKPDNQDNLLADGKLFAVADGLGGHKGGATASQLALAILQQTLQETPHEAPQESLHETPEKTPEPFLTKDTLAKAFIKANDIIYKTSYKNPESLGGMGTTLCAIYLNSPAPILDDSALDSSAIYPEVLIANVGDSRLYEFRTCIDANPDTVAGVDSNAGKHQLVQFTKDHQHESSPYILTRALGVEPEVEVDSWEIKNLPQSTRYLLCTDGLTNEVPDEVLETTLNNIPPPASELQTLVDNLVELALENGGRDNISAILVDIKLNAD